MWAFSKSGNFTVRSCYHNLVVGKLTMETSTTSLAGSASPLWDWIWELKVPPKVRTFIWRACHEILPTRVALMRRHVGSNPYCEFCLNDIGTATHTFFRCSYFLNIWSVEPFSISLDSRVQNFGEGIRRLKELLDEAKFGLACVVCWNIWNLRNDLTHNNDRGDRESLVRRSGDFLNSYKSARFVSPVKGRLEQAVSRKPHDAPFIKINFDAAVYDSNIYQLAAVARDETWTCLKWRIKKLRGSPSPVGAEACAARLAILLAHEMGWPSIHLEGDCLQVINSFNDQDNECLQPFAAVISSGSFFISSFSSFTASFIRRAGNSFAHALAHLLLTDSDVLDGVIPPAGLVL